MLFMDDWSMSNKDRHGRNQGQYEEKVKTIESRKVKIDLCVWHTQPLEKNQWHS